MSLLEVILLNIFGDRVMSDKRLIGTKEVLRKRGDSKSKLYKDLKEGKFPLPIKHGTKSLWLESEVDSWIDSLVKKSRQVAA